MRALAVVLDEAALAGAARVGRSVASQLVRPFEQVEQRGAPGLCPLCHLSVIEVGGRAGEVECATCAAGDRARRPARLELSRPALALQGWLRRRGQLG